jgi:hypothetical protein
MIEILCKMFDYLLAHYALYMVVCMGLLIMITNTILMFVKKPIKNLTAKITNEKLRKLANKMFIVFAFGLSALGWFVMNKISAWYFPFEEVNVLLTGAFSIVIYSLGDGIINKSQANILVDNVKEIAKDGKVDKKEKTATKEFWDKVK